MTTKHVHEEWVAVSEVKSYLAAFDRLVDAWSNGELSDDEFRYARARLVNMDTGGAPYDWFDALVVPLD